MKSSAPAGADNLEEIAGVWLVAYGATHDDGTTKNAEGYAGQWVGVLGGLDAFTEAGYAKYIRERIARVSRTTLRKELSALRQFVSWLAVEHGVKVPPVPGLPKHGHPGARAKNARRRQATILSPAEVEAILAEVTSGLRPFFRVCWETSLRPFSTVAALEYPTHYAGGDLFIAREIDKAKYERTVPVTPACRAALDASLLPGVEGPIFRGITKDGIRWVLEAAAERAGIKRPVSIYDFRHSRISYWANSGRPLAGVSFLAGHLHISTTAKYVTSSRAAADAVLEESPTECPSAPETLSRPGTRRQRGPRKPRENAAP